MIKILSFISFQLILSLWGSVLSTLLAILAVNKYRRESKVEVILIASIEKNFEDFKVSICNNSITPVTLSKYSLAVGVSPKHQTELIDIPFEPNRKLMQSDVLTISLAKREVKFEQIESAFDHYLLPELFINIYTSNKKKYSAKLFIDPQINFMTYPLSYLKSTQFASSYEQSVALCALYNVPLWKNKALVAHPNNLQFWAEGLPSNFDFDDINSWKKFNSEE